MEVYENDVFYSPYGQKIWELRYEAVSKVLNQRKIGKVK